MTYQRLAGGGTWLGVAVLLISCSRSPTPAGPPAGSAAGAAASSAVPPHADAAGIDWYRGEVSDAFGAARTAHKPILLYWGAIWCPPCKELKSTVFSRPDFIARSRLFLPVYLDGDEAGAQKWGEKFHVSGYPTLVVLNAEGRELMRIAGGMDLNQYATVLDTALADLQPADALLSTAAAGKALDAQACRPLPLNNRGPDVDPHAATADPDFSEADQLSAVGSKLVAIKTVKGAIPAGVARAARARVAATLAEEQIPYVRSGVINAVLPIFELLNENERAYKLVQGELKKTATPYYYKADLGELAESLGRKDEALKWYSEGYTEARGIATRFQSGSIYASSLLRLAPDDTAKITEVTSR